MDLADDIKHKALELGFDLVGVTDAAAIDAEQVESLTTWLECGFAGQMSYMHRNLEKRIDPAKLLENAQSVVAVGLNYKPPRRTPKPPTKSTRAGEVASYAQYEDYHGFIKGRLRTLAGFITSIAGAGHEFKICVDSAPLLERALAVRAGLGFIGKNHMLINPRVGPQIFLGEIMTTLKIGPDEPLIAGCPDCNNCVSACPTGALRADGQFDANKCISYLTIEYKGPIPPDLAQQMGDWLFGCDECVLACPYQQNAPLCANKQFKFYDDGARLDLRRILDMTQQDFEGEFVDSPIRRLGLDRLKRNARICRGNTTQPNKLLD